MNVLFNELSYLFAPKNLKPVEIISYLTSLGKAASFFRALSPVNQVVFWTADREIHADSHVFLNGQNLRNLLGLVDHESRVAILALINRLNYLDTANATSVVQPNLNLSTTAVPAFFMQAPQNLGLLSVFTCSVWCANQVNFIDGAQSLTLKNWPEISLNTTLQKYLAAFESYFKPLMPRIRQNDHPMLPYRTISNMMLQDAKYVAHIASLSHGDRLAAFQMAGGAVARINQYIERPDLNTLNSSGTKKRNIFHNTNLDKYLSIDYEKGAFEFLDAHGCHLGEFNFEGRNIGPADTKHRHDIVLKQR